jgi:Polyketide cyclase / dehydrase and lipid transport
MSRQVSVVAKAFVPAGPARVFERLVDVPGQGDWMVGTRVFAVEGSTPAPEARAVLLAVTGVGGFGLVDELLVTECEPPARWVVEHHGRVIRGTGTFEVAPAPGGSTVTWHEDLTLPFGLLGRAGWPVVKPLVGWGLRRSLRTLAGLVPRSQ